MGRYIGADELFPISGPFPDDMIGRRREVESLLLLLGQVLHRFVAGPRRQGKTTVCLAVAARLRRDGFHVVHADLFMLPTLERFAEALVEQVWANRSPPRRVVRGLGHGGRATVSAVGAAATVRLRTAGPPPLLRGRRPAAPTDL
ncbi:MAG: hypothetical protein ACRDWN_07040 [Acidimicrobiales bacterium]